MEPERLVSSGMTPPGEYGFKLDAQTAEKLYLNPEGFQVGKQLRRVLMMNHVHAQSSGVFQVQRAVVNKHAFFRGPLGYFERDTENRFLRFTRVQVTGAEKSGEVFSQMKCLDAILVQFQRLVVNGRNQVFARARCRGKDRPGLGIFLGLRKHERGELFPRKCTRPIKQCAVEILVQADLPRIKRRKREIMAILKIFPIELKGLCGLAAGFTVPTVRQDDAANIPEQCRDWGQV